MSTQAISFIGGAIKVGDAASPEVFTSIKEIQKGQFSGNKVDFPDVTNIDSPNNYREYIATFIDAGEFSFEANFIHGDASQTSLYTMRDALAKHNWEVILPGAAGQWSFVAYVASIDVSNLETSKQIVISVKLKITGKVTFA